MWKQLGMKDQLELINPFGNCCWYISIGLVLNKLKFVPNPVCIFPEKPWNPFIFDWNNPWPRNPWKLLGLKIKPEFNDPEPWLIEFIFCWYWHTPFKHLYPLQSLSQVHVLGLGWLIH